MTVETKQHSALLLSNPAWQNLMEYIDTQIQEGAIATLEMDEDLVPEERAKLKAWKELKAMMLAKIHNSL